MTYEDAIELGFKYVRKYKSELSVYCICWSGCLNRNDDKFDAIFCEVGEKNRVKGLQIAPQYKVNISTGDII